MVSRPEVGGEPIIGQHRLLRCIDTWKCNDTFPHFMLLVGAVGSGRRTLGKWIGKQLGVSNVAMISDCSVDRVRLMISQAYAIDTKILYLLTDVDGMSVGAKNALLKLTEEPPANAYIAMTLTALSHTLPTLVSRSQHLILDVYTPEELCKFSQDELIPQIGTTPGMVKSLDSKGRAYVNKLVEFASKLFDYIDKVSIANALKSSNMLKLSNKAVEGYSWEEVGNAIRHVAAFRLRSNTNLQMLRRAQVWLHCIAKYDPFFAHAGLNQQSLYDKLVFEVRAQLHAYLSEVV